MARKSVVLTKVCSKDFGSELGKTIWYCMMSYDEEKDNKSFGYTHKNGAYFCDGDELTKENLKIGTFYEERLLYKLNPNLYF